MSTGGYLPTSMTLEQILREMLANRHDQLLAYIRTDSGEEFACKVDFYYRKLSAEEPKP